MMAIDNWINIPHGYPPADHERWSRIGRWTIDEATALSFGVEPLSVGELRALQAVVDPWGRQYLRLRELGREAQTCGKLAEVIAPLEYIAWAKSVGVPFPTELETMVVTSTSATATAATLNWPPKPTVKPKKQYRALNEPADRESVVLVRLTAAVSAAFYNFDLQKDTSPVITEIINALALHGPVSDRETVKGWLDYAARVGGQADGLLRTRVKGTFCKLLSGMLRDLYGWLPTAEESHAGTAEERAARAKKLREARAEELHADLAKAGMVVSVEDILEALTFVNEFV